MTQSGGAKNTFFLATLYNFQKSGRAIALPAPPPPRSLLCPSHFVAMKFFRRCFCKKTKTSGFTSDLCDILMLTFLVSLPKEDQGSNESWKDNGRIP